MSQKQKPLPDGDLLFEVLMCFFQKLKMNPETRMFEEYRLWDLTSGVPELIDEQRFDRTILIQ